MIKNKKNHSSPLERRFFFVSSPNFLFLNSDSPGSRLIMEFMVDVVPTAVFSAKRILGSEGTTGLVWFENLILGNCKFTAVGSTLFQIK